MSRPVSHQLAQVQSELGSLELARLPFPAEIDAAEAQRDVFNQEIARLTDSLEKLKSSANELENFIRVHKSQMAPVHRLPVELISEIFSIVASYTLNDPRDATDPDKDGANNLSTGRNMVALNLSHVDSRWRAICLSLPFLWSYFTLNVKPGIHLGDQANSYSVKNAEWRKLYLFLSRGSSALTDTSPGILALLGIYLERSGSCPLSINITCPGRDSNMGYNDSPALCEADQALVYALVPHASRFRHLTVPKPIMNAIYRSANPSFMPTMLETLVISHTDDKHALRLGRFLDNVSSSLTYIRCSSRDLNSIMSVPRLVLSHVTKIIVDPHVDHHSYFQNIPIVFPNLQELKMPMCMIQGPLHLDGPIYTLPNLHTLSLSNIAPVSASWRILSCLCLPALKHLYLGAQFSIHPLKHNALLRYPSAHLPRLLLRSGCQLESLTLRLFAITAVELTEILLLTPDLQELNLTSFPDYRRFKTITNSFGRALLDKAGTIDDSFSLIPKLRTLRLKGAFQCDPSLLAEVVERRFKLDLDPSMMNVDLDVVGDDRHLEKFVLKWQGPVLDDTVRQRFLSYSRAYPGRSMELWERDDDFRGYGSDIPRRVPSIPSTMMDIVMSDSQSSSLSVSSSGSSIDSAGQESLNQLLARARQGIEIARIQEELDHNTEGSPIWLHAQQRLAQELDAVQRAPPVPLEEQQEEPILNSPEDFDDLYYVPGFRRYQLTRIV